MKLASVLLLVLVGTCSDCGSSLTPQQSTDITIGVNAAACIIRNGAADLAAGMSPGQIVADLVAKCGVTVAQIATIFDEQAAAEAKVGHADLAPKWAAIAVEAHRQVDAGP